MRLPSLNWIKATLLAIDESQTLNAKGKKLAREGLMRSVGVPRSHYKQFVWVLTEAAKGRWKDQV